VQKLPRGGAQHASKRVYSKGEVVGRRERGGPGKIKNINKKRRLEVHGKKEKDSIMKGPVVAVCF